MELGVVGMGLGVIEGESGRLSESGNLSVLVVDAEWIVARGVQKTLEVHGYVVTGVVSSAHDALISVERRRPDLALIDIVIAGPVDGINLACLLRERQGIPAIFLTAHTDQPVMQRALGASPLGYVVKPFQESQLLSSVRLAAAALPTPVSATTAEDDDAAPGDQPAPDDADTTRQNQFRQVARVLSDWPPRSPKRQVLTRVSSRSCDCCSTMVASPRLPRTSDSVPPRSGITSDGSTAHSACTPRSS